jgi:hypothetical protein
MQDLTQTTIEKESAKDQKKRASYERLGEAEKIHQAERGNLDYFLDMILQFAKFSYYEQEQPSQYFTFVYFPEYKYNREERYFKMMLRVVSEKKLNNLKKGLYSPEVKQKRTLKKKKNNEMTEHKLEPKKEYIGIQFMEIQIEQTDDSDNVSQILVAEVPTETFEYGNLKVEFSCRTRRDDNLEHFVERGY